MNTNAPARVDVSTGELIPASDPILGMDPELASRAMARHRDLTAALLTGEDYQPVGKSKFVKRSGFQKIAFAYDISTEILSRTVARNKDGDIIRADATVRAIRPDGRHADGDGACAVTEERFRDRRGRLKVDHDLPATAVTRAKNRAIADLVGFGQVSAEEIDGDDFGRSGPPTDAPGWALHVPGDRIAQMAGDLTRILVAAGITRETAEHVTLIGEATFKACDGGIPEAVARFTALLADVIQNPTPAPADATGGPQATHPSTETPEPADGPQDASDTQEQS